MDKRLIPFDEEEICDVCGAVGAFDFMGDLLCPRCTGRRIKREERSKRKKKKIRGLKTILKGETNG